MLPNTPAVMVKIDENCAYNENNEEDLNELCDGHLLNGHPYFSSWQDK